MDDVTLDDEELDLRGRLAPLGDVDRDAVTRPDLAAFVAAGGVSAAGRGIRRSLVAGGAAVVSTLAGKLAIGGVLVAGATGVAHYTGAVDVPGLPGGDEPAVVTSHDGDGAEPHEHPQTSGRDEAPGRTGATPGQSGATPADGAPPPGQVGATPGQDGSAPGHDPAGPGNSENTPSVTAPGQTESGGDEGPGQSGSAPGQSRSGDGDGPGKSGSAPGQNETDGPRKSGSAPGQNKSVDDPDDANDTGGDEGAG